MIKTTIVCLVFVAVLSRTAYAERGVSASVSMGPILHGSAALEGVVSFGLDAEASILWHTTDRLSIRLDGVWMRFKNSQQPKVEPLPNTSGAAREALLRGDLEFAGAKLNLIAFSRPKSWGDTYVLVGAGWVTVNERPGISNALLIAPGLGMRLGRGSTRAGLEINLEVIVDERGGSMPVLPVRMVIWF